jgi:hypothetical protein
MVSPWPPASLRSRQQRSPHLVPVSGEDTGASLRVICRSRRRLPVALPHPLPPPLRPVFPPRPYPQQYRLLPCWSRYHLPSQSIRAPPLQLPRQSLQALPLQLLHQSIRLSPRHPAPPRRQLKWQLIPQHICTTGPGLSQRASREPFGP